MADLDKIVDDLSGLTVIEAADLVKKLEEKWDVSAAAPAAVAVVAAGGGDGGGEEEKSSFDVVLTGLADASKKISVIKAVRGVKAGLGLKEAKEMVEGVPKQLKSDIKKEEAND